ncbi:trypsin-like serine peptidase [Hymenobacter metallilatus]|uniref:Serine protease n=1 Tax=Hymenobacter metallilatus TaxID=2493666 RepID=A0A428IY71_9BACT|nr:serine protease [Hymenobacter metallilatus]RSK24042.1 serine protease [Hymenobacter metallilatus]
MSDEAAEAQTTDTESFYESVEGWQETDPTESSAEAEPVVEASMADLEASEGSQEFFGALAALVLPLAKAVLPTLAGAAVKQGTKLVQSVVKPKAKKLSPAILQMLRQAGVNPAILKQLEFSEATDDEAGQDEAGGFDETDVEALAQQIEALEVVIGVDDRVQITNTSVVPWKRICHLKIQAADGKNYLGTGFFIGPRTILTAGHCVYIHGHGGWPRQIVVTPGRNAANEPFQRFTATAFRSVQGWVNNKARNYDYGVIQLPRNASVSPSIGAFGFGQFPDQFLLNKRLNTAGYPGDKPAGTMWFNGRKAKSVTARTITYDIDTAGGQSGSPVWFKDAAGSRIVVGIHTNGASSGNSATRITKPVFDNLKKWRMEGGA